VELVGESRALGQPGADGVDRLARRAGTLEREPGAHAGAGLATNGNLLVDRILSRVAARPMAVKRHRVCNTRRGIDTSTAAGQLVPGVLASIPVFERARIQERIRAGLSRAKAHGTRLGRRRSVIGKETVVCRFTCACENRQVPGVNPLQEMGTEAWHGWSQHREQRQLEKQAAATASNGRCSDDGANVLEFQHDDCGWLAGPTKCLGRCWNAVRK
jgi:hypothetical protein